MRSTQAWALGTAYNLLTAFKLGAETQRSLSVLIKYTTEGNASANLRRMKAWLCLLTSFNFLVALPVTSAVQLGNGPVTGTVESDLSCMCVQRQSEDKLSSVCVYVSAESSDSYTQFSSQLGAIVPEKILQPNSSVALVKVASRYFSICFC